MKCIRRWVEPHPWWYGLTHPMHWWWMDLTHNQSVRGWVWTRRGYRWSARLRMSKVTLRLRCRRSDRGSYWRSERAVMTTSRSAYSPAPWCGTVHRWSRRLGGRRLVLDVVTAVAVSAADRWAACCTWRCRLLLQKKYTKNNTNQPNTAELTFTYNFWVRCCQYKRWATVFFFLMRRFSKITETSHF